MKGFTQSLLFEQFNYTSDPTNGLFNQSSGAWTNVNTGDSILVTDGSLSYSGLVTSVGNKIAFDGAGTDAYRAFTSQSTAGTTVYFSFILNVSSLGSLNTTGSYFTGLASSTSSFGGIIQVRKSSVDATKYNLGISVTTSSTIGWSSQDYSTGTSYFIVGSYQLVSGTLNDVSNLWVNPILGETIEPTPLVNSLGGTGADLTSVKQIFLRQANVSTTPFIEIDEIRVGLSWADVTPAAIAPVNFIHFSGVRQSNLNKLSWSTATEMNNTGFDVQASVDGINWTTLAFVNSKVIGGNSNAILQYEYKDTRSNLGSVYYRLRQVDLDGKYAFSSIVLIKSTATTQFAIENVYPNPAKRNTTLWIASSVKDKATIVVTDESGRKYIAQSASLESGSNAISLNLSTLAPGNYYIKVMNSKGESCSTQLIKE